MKLKKMIESLIYLLNKIYKYTPFYLIITIISYALTGMLNIIISVYLVMILFDSIQNRCSYTRILFIVLIMVLLQIINQSLQAWYLYSFVPIQKLKLHIKLQSNIFDKATTVDISCYDDPSYYDNFIFSLNEFDNRANSVIKELGENVECIISFILILPIMQNTSILILLFILISVIISAFLQTKLNKKYFYRSLKINPFIRQNDYIVKTFYLRDFAKELRLTKIHVILKDQFKQTITKMNNIISKYSPCIVAISMINILLTSIIFDMAIMLFLAYKMLVCKTLTIGGYAAATNAVWSVRFQLSGLFRSYSSLHDSSLYIEKFIEFMNYSSKVISKDQSKIPINEPKKISIHNVSFKYSTSENTIFNKLNLEIAPKERVAIVGINGAGKSTLVKLLLRLYDPNKGEIKFNDINIKDYNVNEYRKGFGVVFQDFNLYSATIGENIFMDTLDSCDTSKLKGIQINTNSDKQPLSIESILTREFSEDGIILSGGQSQRIAVERALCKECHTIILDEPSSALDPISEYNINRSILKATEGKTVIFISHRLSTTLIADTIYMVENGKIIEKGSHNELMRLNGKYAHMFNVQASKYSI